MLRIDYDYVKKKLCSGYQENQVCFIWNIDTFPHDNVSLLTFTNTYLFTSYLLVEFSLQLVHEMIEIPKYHSLLDKIIYRYTISFIFHPFN